MKAVRRFIGVILFGLIFASVFSVCDRILVRKSVDGWWNVTEKLDGFYNSPENEYDVMFFGSSNTYCSFNPLEIWEKTGVKSYVFATQQQPVWASYHYMKEAFKTQKPKLAVMDVLMFSKNDEYYDDGVNYTFCDNMPFSVNKVELAYASAPAGERFGLLCRFFKYHSRWSELNEQDFKYRKKDMQDFSKGFYVLTSEYDNAEREDTRGVTDEAELSEKNRKYLEKIIALCRENGVELMLVKTPSNSTCEEKKYYNSVKRIAEENGVAFADYNLRYDEIGIDMKTDFFDATHLNVRGAEKFCDCFVKNTPFFENKTRNDNDWQSDYEKYENIKYF